MKKVATILLLFFAVSCSNKAVEIDKKQDHKSKVDSVLRVLVNHPTFPNSSIAKSFEDTSGLPQHDGLDLLKEVYIPYLGLTFEHWLSWDCHDRIEVIICYNDLNYAGIPFYFQRIRENDSLYLDEFCKGLNHAINLFFSDSSDFSHYQDIFIRRVFENIFTYKMIQYSKYEIPFLLAKIKLDNREDGLYFPQECKNEAVENLIRLHESKGYFEIYDIPKRHTQLKIEYNSGKVLVEVINGKCFYELIY